MQSSDCELNSSAQSSPWINGTSSLKAWNASSLLADVAAVWAYVGSCFCITSHDIVDSVGLVVWKLGMFGGTLSKRLYYVIEQDDRSNIGISQKRPCLWIRGSLTPNWDLYGRFDACFKSRQPHVCTKWVQTNYQMLLHICMCHISVAES